MRNSKIEEVKVETERLEKRLDELLSFLGKVQDQQGSGFDVAQDIPGTDSSISDIRARHAAIAGLVRKFDAKSAAIVPLSDINGMTKAVRAISNACDQLKTTFENIENSLQGLKYIDYTNFNAYTGNGNQIDIHSHFKTLFDTSESFLSSFQATFQATSPSRAAFNFSSAAETLSSIIGATAQTRNELSRTLRAAQERLQNVEADSSQIAALLTQATAEQATISEQLGKASEAVGHITSHNATAASLAATSAELQQQVDTYAEQFARFQSTLDKRMAAIESGNTELLRLQERFTEQENSFDELIGKSNQMLSGATVAGLASEFGSIRKDLGAEVLSAHRSFQRAIAILAISAIPLILFIFAPFIAPFISNDDRIINAIAGVTAERSGWQYVGQVLARLVILLPAIWYVTFCSSRYNSLFRLREHYSYKYSMAVAVEGFKKQSPGYEDMVAALVFEQLAFNPADKLGKQKDGPEPPPSPIANLLFSVLRQSATSKSVK